MGILGINAGSSSLKFGLFSDDACERLISGEIDWASGDRRQARLTVKPHRGAVAHTSVPLPDHDTAARCALEAVLSLHRNEGGVQTITAVGHRVVHGGMAFRASVLVDSQVKAELARLGDVAPLHNPPALRAIEAAEAILTGLPQVAVFDTAFFIGLPPKAYLYGVPYQWHQEWGIRRFGFHGLSHEYCAGRAAELLGRDVSQLRIITCHLGGGCSIAAVEGGRPIATTSGFTPLEGPMMGTRSGSVDPGILLHLQRQEGLTQKEMHHALNHSAGLLGISGVSADLAQVEAAAAQGNERAQLAFDMFAEQVRSAIGGLAATLGGVDVLTFADRIGEGSPALRAAVCQKLQFMGVRLDPQRNAQSQLDTDISATDSPVRVFVIHTEEELVVARETRRTVRRS
jgi:acetate kinase